MNALKYILVLSTFLSANAFAQSELDRGALKKEIRHNELLIHYKQEILHNILAPEAKGAMIVGDIQKGVLIVTGADVTALLTVLTDGLLTRSLPLGVALGGLGGATVDRLLNYKRVLSDSKLLSSDFFTDEQKAVINDFLSGETDSLAVHIQKQINVHRIVTARILEATQKALDEDPAYSLDAGNYLTRPIRAANNLSLQAARAEFEIKALQELDKLLGDELSVVNLGGVP